MLRKSPKYITTRLFGVYVLTIVVLVFAHTMYIKDNNLVGMDIIRTTLDNVTNAFDRVEAIANTGGGMIGAVISCAFVKLFDITGTMIVNAVLCVFGLVMLFDINLGNVIKGIIEFFKSRRK